MQQDSLPHDVKGLITTGTRDRRFIEILEKIKRICYKLPRQKSDIMNPSVMTQAEKYAQDNDPDYKELRLYLGILQDELKRKGFNSDNTRYIFKKLKNRQARQLYEYILWIMRAIGRPPLCGEDDDDYDDDCDDDEDDSDDSSDCDVDDD
jgi:hypothetical protein